MYAIDPAVFWFLVAGTLFGVCGGFWAFALMAARLLRLRK